MKLYRYLKTSVFQKDVQIVILRVFFMAGKAQVEKTIHGRYEELTVSEASDFLDAYVVGQSLIGETMYVVCTPDPDFEGVGLKFCKPYDAPVALKEFLEAQ